MTPRWAYGVMFGGPVVLLGGLVVVLAAAEGRFEVLWLFVPVLLGAVLVIAGASWALLRWLTREQAAAFAALAEEFGGTVRRSFFGEFQLRIPQEGGEVVADLRATADTYGQARGGRAERWARIAVEPAGPAAGTLQLDLPEGEPVSEAGLPLDALDAIGALRGLWPGPIRLRVDGTKSPSVAEVWLCGWPRDRATMSDLLREAPSLLRKLAEASAREPS